jgi:hypothetical protein
MFRQRMVEKSAESYRVAARAMLAVAMKARRVEASRYLMID